VLSPGCHWVTTSRASPWSLPADSLRERHGYVTRVPDPVDARARIIELTPRGRQALRVMRSSALDLEKRSQQVLGERRLDELREILQILLAGQRGSGRVTRAEESHVLTVLHGVGSTPRQ
jgi:hypothetical protein